MVCTCNTGPCGAFHNCLGHSSDEEDEYETCTSCARKMVEWYSKKLKLARLNLASLEES